MFLLSLFPAGKYINVSFVSFFRLESTFMFLLSLFPAGKYIHISCVSFSGWKVQLLFSYFFPRLESTLMSLSSAFPTESTSDSLVSFAS